MSEIIDMQAWGLAIDAAYDECNDQRGDAMNGLAEDPKLTLPQAMAWGALRYLTNNELVVVPKDTVNQIKRLANAIAALEPAIPSGTDLFEENKNEPSS